MSTTFASPDIATLVANFPPINISDGRPALVRSRSGDHLVRLSRVSARFHKILETCDSRIPKSGVTTLLGIEEGAEKWLFAEVGLAFSVNRTGQDIIPTPVARIIADNLLAKARTSIVDLSQYANDADIRPEDLDCLIASHSNDEFRRVMDRNITFLIGNHVVAHIEDRLREAIGSAGADICDLPNALSEHVPSIILKELAQEVVSARGGEVRVEGDHITFVPANYSAAVSEKLKHQRDARVQATVRAVRDQDYCAIADQDLLVGDHEDASVESLVLDEWRTQHPEGDQPIRLKLRDANSKVSNPNEYQVLYVMPKILHQGLESLKSQVIKHVETLFKEGDRQKVKVFSQNFDRGDLSTLVLDDLARLVSRSEHREDISLSLSRQIEDWEKEEQEHLTQLVEARLLIPLQLYVSGVDAIKDDTLKQHLEEFVTDHFRREVIPQMLKVAQEQSLLRDKDKERQVEKFRQASFEAKALPNLQVVTLKFMKKLKITPPSDSLIRRVKHRTLEASAKSINQMKRGSDILQNLIWILLAQKSDGLYMSSGKDTSRMIKQYQSVGDPETSRRLLQWRDKLKNAQESQDDLQAMKNAAKDAVQQLANERRSSSVSSSQLNGPRRLSSPNSSTVPG